MHEERRLIEVDFPLKQTSLDAVHEKNVRHGHLSTLHIWPARRPLAACRAALLTALLPAPESEQQRRQLLQRIAGRVKDPTRQRQRQGARRLEHQEETEGGVLHWGRETDEALEPFRQEIRAAFGGRAPRVLDPFAGGGAIPLEAMRLGCEVTAIDLNPVAWFLLKCTLEYPWHLTGERRRLPDFVLGWRPFMEAYLKAQGLKGTRLEAALRQLGVNEAGEGAEAEESPRQHELTGLQVAVSLEAEAAWHVRAWGEWVLQRARAVLAGYYPTVDDRPTVAYLWARTMRCKNCRAMVPLLKTRWLARTGKKRVALKMEPNAERTGVAFEIWEDVPLPTGTAQERRAFERRVGGGTMSRTGVTCPCCGTVIKMEDIRFEGMAGRLGTVLTAVIVEGKQGKEYRLPTEEERRAAEEAADALPALFAAIPFGLPEEPLPSKETLGIRVPLYGFSRWHQLFTPRQLLALGTFVRETRAAREELRALGYPPHWVEAISAYLALALDRTANYMSTLCFWEPVAGEIKQTFLRFALPISWDFAEANPLSLNERFYNGAIINVTQVLGNLLKITKNSSKPTALNQSATQPVPEEFDLVVTDPPYYDAIPYSDLMDFFYVWLRRSLHGLSPEIDAVFAAPLAPKWDHERNDGELIDDASRFGGDRQRSRAAYEDGMYRAFQACYRALRPDGRLVIVFAHKQPDAWETLVAALIRAGFVVTASWPIATEMRGGVRNFERASLSSSIWLVCRRRPESTRPGWDKTVLAEMRQNITERLRHFWDVGIRGPDFIWSATGAALEIYSRYPVVKKADQPGQLMNISEFLRHVRRIVVDFMVGRVLSQSGDSISELDDLTAYYLLHRYSFGFEPVPSGVCILYAMSCGLSDRDLVQRYDLLSRGTLASSSNGSPPDEDDEEEDEGAEEVNGRSGESSGSNLRLKSWQQRRQPHLGQSVNGKDDEPPPLIDQVHHLMHLWKAGDVRPVNDYLDHQMLDHKPLFRALLQALIELAAESSDERSLLESISNYLDQRKGLPNQSLPFSQVQARPPVPSRSRPE
ncbi:DNA methylase [Thermogemmatispora aurantia]|nr:DUF1156 domain-containing protein [Thermogemmatispora aurantia]GER84351.1 DNA methylase [Thermogemmatispora aurantia]